MKKDTSHTLKRAQRFPVILIGEGLLVGAVSGLIVMFYRISLPDVENQRSMPER